jgi:thiamine-phosphate pyrophosphorylase
LMQTGIHGIAVSGLITESRNKTALITKLNDTLYGNIII